MKQFVIEYVVGDGVTFGVTTSFHLMAESKEEIFVKFNDAVDNYNKVNEEYQHKRLTMSFHDRISYFQNNPDKNPFSENNTKCIIGDFKLPLTLFDYKHISENDIFTLEEYLTYQYNQNVL